MKSGYYILGAFMLTIPASNWLISNVGTVCVPDGPCMIPVGFGLLAPSGVLVVGIGLVLRDLVHETLGALASAIAIVVGALLSIWIAAPEVAFASGAAFLLSETADLIVYAPLRKKRLYLALALSGLVGSLVDSFVFQNIAFNTSDFVFGQTVGKFWMVLITIPALWFIRNRCALGMHHWLVHESYGYGFTEKCSRCGEITDRGGHWN